MKKVDLAPHQVDAVRRLRNGSILTGGVGTGKTRVALQYYIEKEMGKDVYVITTAKKRDSLDWEGEAALHGVGRDTSVPREGRMPGRIIVDSWNNIGKYVYAEGAFFIFDEQRLVGSGAWVKGFRAIAKKNNWILLSATPGDTWLDYIPVFVAHGFYKNKTEFLREHVVYSRFSKFPKVERFIGVNRLVRHRNSLLVDMPYERHTTRHIHHVDVEYDEELYKKAVKDRWHPYESRPLRDVAELFGVMRKVVNTDASRLEVVRSLITHHPKLIVFYNFDYELEQLRKLGEPWISETSSTEQNLSRNSRNSSSARSATKSIDSSRERFSKGDQWAGTIWAVDYIPEDPRKDPRKSIDHIKKKYDYEKAMRFSGKLLTSEKTSTESPGILTSTQSSSQTPESKTLTDGLEGSTTTGQATNTSPRRSNNGSKKTSSITAESHATCLTIQDFSAKGVVVAEWNGHKHEPIPQTDRWVYLVQYTAGAEGWNCIDTDTVVFYSMNYSYRIFEQCQGRIDRLNTPFKDLNYYILRSKASIDVMIWKALRVKKRFNEPKTEEALAARKTAV